ncbi:MAG TPA: DUF3107 domain-containing protein [Propionibacteriaceae bacterium]|nr:DUF3107 domain-containing protein [Propionibacteriaceae bacterium]
MEIKIGIQNIAREVAIEAEASGEDVERDFAKALEDNGVLTLTDERGRKLIVPARTIGYLDLGQEHARPVGFGQL